MESFWRESPVRYGLALIKEWTLAHRRELEANWKRVETGEPLEKIAPLD